MVIGTDGYGIHIYTPYTTHINYPFGSFDATYGVPNAWEFLLFCALWTIVAVVYALIHSGKLGSNVWLNCASIGVEAVALLSWFAGFIAVAVSVGSNACEARSSNGGCCGAMTAAAVFGALEWVLLTITGTLTTMAVLNNAQGRRSQTGPEAMRATTRNSKIAER